MYTIPSTPGSSSGSAAPDATSQSTALRSHLCRLSSLLFNIVLYSSRCRKFWVPELLPPVYSFCRPMRQTTCRHSVCAPCWHRFLFPHQPSSGHCRNRPHAVLQSMAGVQLPRPRPNYPARNYFDVNLAPTTILVPSFLVCPNPQ